MLTTNQALQKLKARGKRKRGTYRVAPIRNRDWDSAIPAKKQKWGVFNDKDEILYRSASRWDSQKWRRDQKFISRNGTKWCVFTRSGKMLSSHDDQQEAKLALNIKGGVSDEKVTKSSRFVPIIKADEEERFILGIVYEPDELDAHGEWATAPTIRKAAHLFLSEFGDINLMHVLPLEKRQVSIVESFIAPIDFNVNGQLIKKGSWVLAATVHDNELWDMIKKGEIKGWSLEGIAQQGPEEEMPVAAMKNMFSKLMADQIPALVKQVLKEERSDDSTKA